MSYPSRPVPSRAERMILLTVSFGVVIFMLFLLEGTNALSWVKSAQGCIAVLLLWILCYLAEMIAWRSLGERATQRQRIIIAAVYGFILVSVIAALYTALLMIFHQ